MVNTANAHTPLVIASQGLAQTVMQLGHVLLEAEQVILKSFLLHNRFLAKKALHKPPVWTAELKKPNGPSLVYAATRTCLPIYYG